MRRHDLFSAQGASPLSTWTVQIGKGEKRVRTKVHDLAIRKAAQKH